MVSSAGSVLDHVVYDSFGNITTETNASNGDRFKFAGMEYNASTGQNYDHARWYGAVVGRFLSQDPSQFGANDANLYRFVANDSVNGTDPTGLDGDGPTVGNLGGASELTQQPPSVNATGPTVENLAGGYWAGAPGKPGNPWPTPTGPMPTGPNDPPMWWVVPGETNFTSAQRAYLDKLLQSLAIMNDQLRHLAVSPDDIDKIPGVRPSFKFFACIPPSRWLQ